MPKFQKDIETARRDPNGGPTVAARYAVNMKDIQSLLGLLRREAQTHAAVMTRDDWVRLSELRLAREMLKDALEVLVGGSRGEAEAAQFVNERFGTRQG